MVGHDTGSGIGAEVVPGKPRGVTIHDQPALLRGHNFGEYLYISMQDAGHVHHFGKAQHTLVLQERQQVIGHEDAIGAFV